jgi:hypothetical protein
MDIVEASASYEAWMAAHIAVVKEDLDRKHAQMTEDPFSFLRATYYRWASLWSETCPELAEAPEVLAVGDLHVENFGTWRDAEGRLVWGINDFDEAWPLPYTLDLVRLAASALLARRQGKLAVGAEEVCQGLLDGYAQTLASGGQPFVLEENHGALRTWALSEERNPVRFWQKMEDLRECENVPAEVRRLLEAQGPEPGVEYRVVHRTAGLGSLGRPRYVGLATWRGGRIAREAKALLPSAQAWAAKMKTAPIHYGAIIDRAIRCPDPFLRIEGAWLIRRLAPHCSRIELASLPKQGDQEHLLHAMGRETAHVHAGTGEAVDAVRTDLGKRRAGWLRSAADGMSKRMLRDWEDWKVSGTGGSRLTAKIQPRPRAR